MKVFATILLFLTIGSTFASKAVLQSLAEIDRDPFGSTILSAISLNLKARTPIAEVQTLLQGILDDLLADAQSLQTTFSSQSDNLNGAINNGNSLLATYATNIANLEDSINTDAQTRDTKRTTLANTQESFQFEQNRLAKLESDFQATVPVQDSDLEDLGRAITAISNALSKMQSYQDSQNEGVNVGAFLEVASNTQKEMMSVSNTINRMKKTLSKRSNLYTPLVRELLDLTANLEESKSERVISLLQQLLELLSQAQRDVQTQRATFITDYNNNKQQAQDNSLSYTGQIAQLQQEIENLETRIAQAQGDLAAARELQDAAQSKLEADTQNLENVTAFFNDQNPRYQNLVTLVRKIIDYFSNNVASVDEYTRGRLENNSF